ncbi:MAG: phosphatase PAP2 family protein [Sphingomonadaceae bacterium]
MTTRLTRFIEARLSPEGEFGLHLSAGVLLLALASAVFGYLAHAVLTQQGIVVLDLQLAQWLHQHASEPLTSLMLGVSELHSTAVVLLLVALLAWRLWQRQARYWLLALLLVVPGGMLLNVLLKQIFQRSRPVFDEPLVTLLTYSFPSGHTAAATLLYGWLGCWLVMEYRRRALLIVALPACALMVLLVASSRMYLGAHYLSDVLAAMAEGVAWLAICMTAMATLRRRQLKNPAAVAGH